MTKFPGDLKLADGTALHLRLLRPDDRHELQQLFARCSPASIRFRFLHQVRALTEEALDHLTNPDGTRHLALAVTYQRHIIAVGRYQAQADRPAVAEVSFLVEDAWQKRGIGTQLLNILVELARAHGIIRFSADVLADNMLMLSVFRKSGYALCSSTSYGVTHLEFPIVPEQTEVRKQGDDGTDGNDRTDGKAQGSSLAVPCLLRSIVSVPASLFRSALSLD